jgi:hypothetical protein
MLYIPLEKTRNEDHIMRLLILAAAASLAITSTAMAANGKEARHHHYRDANASVPDGSIPADTLSPHEAHLVNLRDSGYNPAGDFTAVGNVKN